MQPMHEWRQWMSSSASAFAIFAGCVLFNQIIKQTTSLVAFNCVGCPTDNLVIDNSNAHHQHHQHHHHQHDYHDCVWVLRGNAALQSWLHFVSHWIDKPTVFSFFSAQQPRPRQPVNGDKRAHSVRLLAEKHFHFDLLHVNLWKFTAAQVCCPANRTHWVEPSRVDLSWAELSWTMLMAW